MPTVPLQMNKFLTIFVKIVIVLLGLLGWAGWLPFFAELVCFKNSFSINIIILAVLSYVLFASVSNLLLLKWYFFSTTERKIYFLLQSLLVFMLSIALFILLVGILTNPEHAI